MLVFALVSFLVLQSSRRGRERELVALVVMCRVTVLRLPSHGAVVWSAACDCGIS